MATPTEDLVLRVLQDIQGTLADHGRKLSRLESGQNEIRESIVTALGLSAHANVRNDQMEDRLEKLEAMAGEVAELRARVARLETHDA
jgi:ubiquinone biosynthesis protein UbiJ